MIEIAVYVALGFASAGLVLLAVLPAFWRRAYRLSRRRIEATLPISPAEIAAERDQLRAGFAVERRRIEQQLDEAASLRQKEMRLSGERLATIAARDAEIRDRIAAHDALEAVRADLAAKLATTEQALQTKSAEHDRLSQEHSDLQDIRARLASDLSAVNDLSNQRRVEIAALSTRVEAKVADNDELLRSLAEVQKESTGRRQDIARLERELHDAAAGNDRLTFRLTEATAIADTRARLLAERDAEVGRLADEVSTLAGKLSAAEAALADFGRQRDQALHAARESTATIDSIRLDALQTARDLGQTVSQLRADTTRLERELVGSIAERARLTREIAELRRQVPAAGDVAPRAANDTARPDRPRRAPRSPVITARPGESEPREELASRIRKLQKDLPPA